MLYNISAKKAESSAICGHKSQRWISRDRENMLRFTYLQYFLYYKKFFKLLCKLFLKTVDWESISFILK